MSGCSIVMIEVSLIWLRLLTGTTMAILFGLFLNSLKGAPRIDFPLSFLL